jgi:dihydroorotase
MSDGRSTLLRNLSPVAFTDRPSGGRLDVLVDAAGRVAAVDRLAASPPGATVIDCGGAFVSPGWMDLHVHVYHGVADLSIRPADCGLAHGVTTLADAGSAGEANFPGFRTHIAERAAERIVAFLNIGSIGLTAAGRVSEVPCLSGIDVDRTLARIEENRDLIRGVKIRAAANVLGDLGMLPVRLARKVADLARLPLMVHIGAPPAFVEDLLDILRPGDVLTHAFHAKTAATSLTADHRLFERARAAAREGLVFDVGHGMTSLSFSVAAHCLAEGLAPTVISTDLHTGSHGRAVVDLAHVMSKFLALGMTIEEVVARVTVAPRRVVDLPASGFLSVGAAADLSVFDVVHRDLALADNAGETRPAKGLFVPRFAVLGSAVVPAHPSRFETP